ncbi:sugar phosphate isomerase/epimerase family protein [Calycomorphotria hydatis]|uniref:Xylose isomerase-like TIM barrel n=1 Tax=Calycomorphotria hydatis TaxID=2528027 RepID=A0A517T7P3_9PLAN|nr:sugar phosphate isomerase/epimerase [Calycomorphotria hydatis]QDT64396.1 Xylose isomerase-like TIM barrel [Calycomorphotria hydatis]
MRTDHSIAALTSQQSVLTKGRLGKENFPQLNLSVFQTATYRWSLEKDLEGVREAGIPAIGLYRPKLQEISEDYAIDQIAASGLKVSSLSWIGGLVGSGKESLADAWYDVCETLKLASALDCQTVCVSVGARGAYTTRHARRLFVDAMRKMAMAAREYGVVLVIDPTTSAHVRQKPLIDGVSELPGLCEEIDSPNVGLVLDLERYGLQGCYTSCDRDLLRWTRLVRMTESVSRTESWSPHGPGEIHQDGPGRLLVALHRRGYTGHVELSSSSFRQLGGQNYSQSIFRFRDRLRPRHVAGTNSEVVSVKRDRLTAKP